jgi:hypothetical protein
MGPLAYHVLVVGFVESHVIVMSSFLRLSDIGIGRDVVVIHDFQYYRLSERLARP